MINYPRFAKRGGLPIVDSVFMAVMLIAMSGTLILVILGSSAIDIDQGKNQKPILDAISEGNRIDYYLDEAARQSFYLALRDLLTEEGSCARYLTYPLVDQSCSRFTKENIERLSKENFRKATSQFGDFEPIMFEEKGGTLSFFGKASSPKKIPYSGGAYAFYPSFEARLNFNYSYERVQKLAADASLCADKECLSKLVESRSSDDLRFVIGNCDTWSGVSFLDEGSINNNFTVFSNVVEAVDDCARSADTDCTCEIKAQKQAYRIQLENNKTSGDLVASAFHGSSLTISGALDSLAIRDAVVKDYFNLPMDGNPVYLKKTANELSLSDSAGRACTIDKKNYRVCGLTDKIFYFYVEDYSSVAVLKATPLRYRFAVKLADKPQAESKAGDGALAKQD